MSYHYKSPSDALRRFAFLSQVLRQAGSHPMRPDDIKVSTPASRENASFIEWVDLSNAIRMLPQEQQAALYVEYAFSEMMVDGPKYGKNKIEELRRRCGMRLGPDRYMQLVTDGVKRFGEILMDKGWMPRPKRMGDEEGR